MELRLFQLTNSVIILLVIIVSLPDASKAFSQSAEKDIVYANFKVRTSSYLNITRIGADLVQDSIDCAFACLEIRSCFSYNLAALSDNNRKLLCEPLPSDKYNNSDKFVASQLHHHYSIMSPCSDLPCKNSGTCVPQYDKNSYVCVCTKEYTGKDCQTNVEDCASQPCKNNGTCTNRVNGYNCSCAPEFNGTQCEEHVGMPCVKAYRMTFPRISTSDYAMKANAIGSSLSAFTVCFFVKLKDPDTPSSALTVYSYAASASPSGNGIYVCLSSPNIAINIGTPKQIDEIKTNSKIEDDQWHHVCVTWENSKGEWQLYMDGQLKENGTGMMKDHHNPSGGTVVFGQDQDSVGGGFETGDAFGPGELTEVNLWGKVLSASDISAQHANCTITQASLVHWWDQFKGGVHGEVQVEEP